MVIKMDYENEIKDMVNLFSSQLAKEMITSHRVYKRMLQDIVIDNTSTYEIVKYDEWLHEWIDKTAFYLVTTNNELITDVEEYCRIKFNVDFNCYKNKKLFSYGG